MAIEIPETLSLENVRSILTERDESKVDIVQRMRALFDARHHASDEAIAVLASGLWHPSVLLRHEIAYVMGQMNRTCALPILIQLLDDKSEHAMVRHEAGEAIAALGFTSQEAFDALERNKDDSNVAVRETVELALIGLQRTYEKEVKLGRRVQKSAVDPTKGFYIFTASKRDNVAAAAAEAPATTDIPSASEPAVGVPADAVEKLDINAQFGTCDPAEGDPDFEKNEKVPELRSILLDENRSLWDRYVAMFTLRNINTEAAAAALADALDEKSSALLRHEICFVLGQLQLSVSLPKLMERLADLEEAGMVRHEAALGLGSVGADVWTAKGREARKVAIVTL